MLAIVFYGLWEIWKERCSMKYENAKRSRPQIIHAIYEHVYKMNLVPIPKRKATHWEMNIQEMLRLPVKTIAIKKGLWIAWSKPESGMIKVNSSGSKRSGNTSGGGVLHHEAGNFIFGFSTTFSHQDTLRAELRQYWKG